MADLSELEGAVLGLIWRQGPLTAHAVRSVFAGSPTPYFSGSEGSIYAVVRRLEGRGLIRGQARAGDARAARDLSVSKPGISALRAWLVFEDSMAGPTPDPIRTRLLFADALSAEERRAWLLSARQALAAEVDSARERIGIGDDDAASRTAARGALTVAQARLDWITDEIARIT